MPKLSAKYQQILWMNVVLISGGVGFLVWKRFDGNLLYAAGAVCIVAVLEYLVMRYSLGRKQKAEQENS